MKDHLLIRTTSKQDLDVFKEKTDKRQINRAIALDWLFSVAIAT